VTEGSKSFTTGGGSGPAENDNSGNINLTKRRKPVRRKDEEERKDEEGGQRSRNTLDQNPLIDDPSKTGWSCKKRAP